MAQYIPKDALVAEIDRRIKAIPKGETDKRLKAVYGNEAFVLMCLLSFIDTLEVKDVDLEKEIPTWIKENPRERPFDDGWFIGMDDCLHRNGYKIKICDLWNLPKEPFNSKEFKTI